MTIGISDCTACQQPRLFEATRLAGRVEPISPIERATRQDGEETQTGAGSLAVTDVVELRPGGEAEEPHAPGTAYDASGRSTGSAPGTDEATLSDEQQQEVAELKERDAEVRRHEQAHVAAGGQYVSGGPSFEYETGPDGKRYATGGEVQIDVSAVDGDPEKTIQKMRQVRAAAMAPAEPSNQDRRVASEAAQLQAEAQAELSAQRRDDASADSAAPEDEAPATRDAIGGETPDAGADQSAGSAMSKRAAGKDAPRSERSGGNAPDRNAEPDLNGKPRTGGARSLEAAPAARAYGAQSLVTREVRVAGMLDLVG